MTARATYGGAVARVEPPGPAGAQGPAGPAGAQGPQGAGAVVATGTLGARPAADAGNAGTYYYATDKDACYLSVPDGAGYAWKVQGYGSRIPYDANDQIAWELTANPSPNVGAAGALDLTPHASVLLARAGIVGTAWEYISDVYATTTDTALGEAANVTLESWVNLSTAPGVNVYVLAKLFGAGGAWVQPWVSMALVLVASSRQVRVVVGNGGNYNYAESPVSQIVPLGVWTHLMATYDGVDMKAYLNGNLVATGAVGAIDWGTSGYWGFGGLPASPGSYVPGLINAPRIANTARAAAWGQEAYQRGIRAWAG